MVDNLIELDKKISIFINDHHCQFIDYVMEYASYTFTWIPVFLFLLFLVYKNFNRKQFYFVLIFTVVLITLTDMISFEVFKENFQRLRPCHDPSLKGIIRIVNNHCGGDYGFISSHASNYFGIATFFGLLLNKKYKYLFYILVIWAVLIAYSRIYLGVHFFGDVLCGSILGFLIGYVIYFAFKWIRQHYD